VAKNKEEHQEAFWGRGSLAEKEKRREKPTGKKQPQRKRGEDFPPPPVDLTGRWRSLTKEARMKHKRFRASLSRKEREGAQI
jgi:hypothetical protein